MESFTSLHGKTISPSRVRGGKAAVAGRPPYHGRARTPCAPQHDKQPERKQKMIVKFITMKGVSGVDGPEHRGDPAPLWDGITPSTATPALHSAAFGGLLSARPRILWDSIPADGGVPPQLWNKTARKTRAKANEIRASAGQLRSYGMVVEVPKKISALKNNIVLGANLEHCESRQFEDWQWARAS